MLRVKVELIPYGDETKVKIIHKFDVANDGTGDSEYGNYIFRSDKDHAWEPSIRSWPRDRPIEEFIYNVLKLKHDQRNRH